jgi:hypothetical protein
MTAISIKAGVVHGALFAGLLALLSGCGSPPVEITTDDTVLAERWGVEITSLRVTAAGSMIDFRYRVLDPAKAAELGNPENGLCLIDQASGVKMQVPSFPKTGPMRQTADQLEAGRIYFIFFANVGRKVHSGSRVTVEIGDFRAENLVVQ